MWLEAEENLVLTWVVELEDQGACPYNAFCTNQGARHKILEIIHKELLRLHLRDKCLWETILEGISCLWRTCTFGTV